MTDFYAHETRAQTVIRVTESYLRRTGTKMPALAASIVEQYLQRVPKKLREIKFHFDSSDVYGDMRANAQIIRRFMEQKSRLPAELEEAWVFALPEPYQLHLLRELSMRYGLPAVHMPESSKFETIDIAQLFKEASEAGLVLVKMLESGNRFGPEDMPLYKEAIQELNDVIGCCVSLQTRITTAVAGFDLHTPPGAGPTLQ